MDKILENALYTVNEEVEHGTVKIADEVVAMIAGLAATEVEGVYSTAGKDLFHKVKKGGPTRGVRVDIANGKVRANLAIVVNYGYNIPSVSAKVQDKVSGAIESMTGLKATDVNIRIAGVRIRQGV
ncbi:MAG: Asp23/Gls24 family envelope stress response protein [Lachnospiraceae bacterium]|nr:Asp23/Gls24 family envelope stress response protein [Lachnospiraceae bacterium]